jgi:hypothetical protein
MKALYDNLTLADLVNTATDEILTEELITMQLVNEGTVGQDYPEEQQAADAEALDAALKQITLMQKHGWLESEEDWWDEVVDTFTNNPQMK